jgi:ATP-binding cassette, subfamily C, bacterial LapB
LNIDARLNITAPKNLPVQKKPVVQPEVFGADVTTKMLQSRTKLIVVLAGLLGQRAVLYDITVALRSDLVSSARISIKTLAIGLKASGLTPDICETKALKAQHWPAIAQMTSGQHILVMGQESGDFIIYDETCEDRRAIVPAQEF